MKTQTRIYICLLFILCLSAGMVCTDRQVDQLQAQVHELQRQAVELQERAEDLDRGQARQALRLEDVSRRRVLR